jgi:hypothetical protein
MKKIIAILVVLIAFIVFSADAKTIQNISAEGSCAIVGMSAEQCQLIALQRARASAIEQAAGVNVTSGTLVTNMALTAEFIKAYAKGFIVKEKAEWLPLTQYQKDLSTPPIPEYRVKIVADVSTPESKIRPIGLNAKTNSSIYKNNERAFIEVNTARTARIAIFNITADDKVVMLYPNDHDRENALNAGRKLVYPDSNSRTELIMHTLLNHSRDTEAFFIVAMDPVHNRTFTSIFTALKPVDFTTFFKRYSQIADFCEDTILAYEVIDAR